ncbi:MAG TPA: hypothetical protein VFM14_06340 [Gemmatimonadales bacterium]|nr:hypothetical protein [Gemmatimonadales bacterium]
MRLPLVAAMLSVAVPAAAQLAPVGVPGGLVRVELTGVLDGYDEQYLDGVKGELGGDLASPALGSDRIPFLSDADARLARITGDPAARLNLGAFPVTADASRTVGIIGVAVGLTSRATLFGRLPVMRTRLTLATPFDSTAGNTGVNPADPLLGGSAGTSQTQAFLAGFDAALVQLQQRLSAGAYDGDPAQRALAEATLADGLDLRADLGGLLIDPATASPFLPTSGSAAGVAVTARIQGLQATLSGQLGVPGFDLLPALPEQRVSQDELTGFLTSDGGTIRGRLDEARFSQRGDAEAGVTFTLLDGWRYDARGTGIRAAITATARFPTGFRERAIRFLDLGTGTGHAAAELTLTTDVGLGRLGARLIGSYERSFGADYVARVTSPAQPYAPSTALRTVHAEPGDLVFASAQPFLRLTPPIAITAGLAYWRRAEGTVVYATGADSIPGIPAAVLARNSRMSAMIFRAGVTYAAAGVRGPDGRGLPLEASWAYERVVDASGGRVPKVSRVRADLRIYVRVWGGDATAR